MLRLLVLVCLTAIFLGVKGEDSSSSLLRQKLQEVSAREKVKASLISCSDITLLRYRRVNRNFWDE